MTDGRDATQPRTTQAVILARGVGSRMRRADPAVPVSARQAEAADLGLKGMIPIERPFLDYVISALADAGITDVCLVIGPEHHAVRAYYTTGVALTRLRVHFAVQEEPRGTADALAAAESCGGVHTVLVLNSDNYYPVAAYQALVASGGAGLIGFDPVALILDSNIPAARVRDFALVTTDASGHLESIVEKPDAATFERLSPTALVSMNLWSFTPLIFEACRRVRPSRRGELELQDAVRVAYTELGEQFRVVPYHGGVLDLSNRGDIPAVARALAGVVVSL